MFLYIILSLIVFVYVFYRIFFYRDPDPIDERIILRALLEEMEEEAKAYEKAERQQL